MEPKAQYIIVEPEIKGTIECACGEKIGDIVIDNGKAWLRLNISGNNSPTYTYALHGQHACGAWLHWTRSEYLLERLIEEAKKRKGC